MSSIAAQERRDLSTVAQELGPDAPTLCEGWTVRDLVAHLVVREGSPLAVGTVLPPLAGALERERLRRRGEDYRVLLGRLRDGPPLLSVFRLPGADRLLNTAELFIHHEDVRRAQPGWQPRALPVPLQDALWRLVQVAGRLAAVRASVGIVAERADNGQRVTLKRGDPSVVVRGTPTEVLLFVHGRRDHAEVELLGSGTALSALRASRLGA